MDLDEELLEGMKQRKDAGDIWTTVTQWHQVLFIIYRDLRICDDFLTFNGSFYLFNSSVVAFILKFLSSKAHTFSI